MLIRTAGLFSGYYKSPEQTAAALKDGWLHTGDAGLFDPDGQLVIIDRVKDVATLHDGTVFAPQYIENKLKFSVYVKEAVAVGNERPYVAAMVNIDMEVLGNWAERRGIGYSGYTDLAQNPATYDLIHEEIRRTNETLAPSQRVKRFAILHKELDPDDAEITRTRKLRRGFINERYAPIIAALYDPKAAERRRQGHRDLRGRPDLRDGAPGADHGRRGGLDAGDARERADPGRRAAGARAGAAPRGSRRSPCASGRVQALSEVSVDIHRGEIVAIIGPNGAGKTTLLNVISGFYHPQEGRDPLRGQGPDPSQALRRRRPRHRPHLPERRPVQGHERARQHHDRAGCSRCAGTSSWTPSTGGRPGGRSSSTGPPSSASSTSWRSRPSARRRPAGCPYGLQKRVELARALAAEPQLLLLDEPMAGMNVEEKEDMSRFILDVHDEFGTTIALIEHDMSVVMDISDRVVALDYGRKIADGPPDAVRKDQVVIDAYLGVDHAVGRP